MKKLIFILFLFAISTEMFSQDLEGIEITTAVGGSQEISHANANVLNSKLENFLTQNGIVKGINSQFVLIGNLDLIQSQNAGGASGNLLMYELSVTTKLLNNADQNVFAQNSQIVKGMGDNKIKAINSALSKINYNTEGFKTFLAQAKIKIADYYTKNCGRILNEASMLEKTNQFDFALYKLTSIPPVATKCYQTSMSKAQLVFQKRINYDCKSKLSQAKIIWSTNQNVESTAQIEELLAGIDPQSSCYKEVTVFTDNVSKRIKELDGREWNVYYKKEVGLEEDRIQAIKEIGKAYGAGQPKQIIQNTKIKL